MNSHCIKPEISSSGRVFEHKITESLTKLCMFDDVLHEDELRKLWGWDVCSIDHLLLYRDYIIPVQEKWCNTRRRETKHMQKFLNSIEYLQSVLPNKRVLFGLWVSRIEPFDDNKQLLHKYNIHAVSHYTSDMDELVSILMEWLKGKMMDV